MMPRGLVRLSELLSAREEEPDAASVLCGDIPIVAKVRFADGSIELRATNTTQTQLILVRPGDLLVSGINALKGAIGIYPSDAPTEAAATIHYGAYKINTHAVLPQFIQEYLRSSRFKVRATSQLPSGIKTELKARKLLAIEIPSLSIDEQIARVEWLNKCRQKLTEFHGRRHSKSEMILGRRVTVGSDTRRSIAARLNEFEQHVRGLCEIRTLGEYLVTNLRHGVSTPCSADADGPPVLMPSSATGFGLDTSRVLYAVSGHDLREEDYLEPGDIIFARGNKPDQVGNCGVFDGERACTAFANLFMRIRVDSRQYSPWFVQYWLMTPGVRDHVKRHTKGTGPSIQKINGQAVKAIPFPSAVPLDLQAWWVDHLTSFRRAASRLEKLQVSQSIDLRALNERISDDAFAGL